ncbi:hypothetical protein A0H81_00740 [Grifola frondosa]|uniref:Uncharacterized protein n=1 Tax=Grifola frondosa TaxID=5627 RepID=A0A1C7MNX7_GRIFR|nr:hypothetical protein A0H81_00740 [Grifola frondosa]
MPSVEYEDELFTGAYPQERSDSPTLGTWDDDTDERDMKPKRRPVVADYIYPRPSSSFAPGRTPCTQDLALPHNPNIRAYLVDSPNSHPPVPRIPIPPLAHLTCERSPTLLDFRIPIHTVPSLASRFYYPALSSTDSSSASTRSSAYTSSAKSGVGITTDDVVQLLAQDAGTSSSSATHGRTPVDQTRWSDFYSNGMRSRSSSVGNSRNDSAHDNGIRVLRGTPSFDMGWQAVDERDEATLGSEEETDDEPSMDEDEDEEVEEEQPASAVVVAEEGRGVIVRGDDVPIVRVHVVQGTTHLLIGSSSTPNAVPAFLTNTLPN